MWQDCGSKNGTTFLGFKDVITAIWPHSYFAVKTLSQSHYSSGNQNKDKPINQIFYMLINIQ